MPGGRKSRKGKRGKPPAINNTKDANSHLMDIPDDKILKFEKNEIVWAKMKFFSAWPSKVCKNNVEIDMYI